MLGIGAMIGAGIVVLSGIAAGEADLPCCSHSPSTAWRHSPSGPAMQSLPAPSSILFTLAGIAVITIITIVEFHDCWKLGLKLFQVSHIAYIYINNNSLKKTSKSKSKL